MAMSVERNQLHEYFDQLLTPSVFEDYSPNGLQVEGKTSLKKVAFAVSATKNSLQESIRWGADALVVHHGVFWKHQGARTITGPWGERLKLAVKNDLNLFAYHLPLDAHPEIGNAVSLAKKLGLTNLKPFALHKKQPMGTKGEFLPPLTAAELKKKCEVILSHQVVLASHDPKELIHSMGIITGGANNDWVKAMEDGLDAYLTGEISEYNWHDAIEANIHYFAGGHHATERFGIQALMEKVEQNFNLDVKFFDSENQA
jgi:dinuclear metal center YbgI/SA1388 family protein